MVDILRVLRDWWIVLGGMLLYGIIAVLGLVILMTVATVIIEGIARFKRIWEEETSEL